VIHAAQASQEFHAAACHHKQPAEKGTGKGKNQGNQEIQVKKSGFYWIIREKRDTFAPVLRAARLDTVSGV
jgi:hypothetical protein